MGIRPVQRHAQILSRAWNRVDRCDIIEPLWVIARVLRWVTGIINGNSGRIPDNDMLRFIDDVDIISGAVDKVLKNECWQYHLLRESETSKYYIRDALHSVTNPLRLFHHLDDFSKKISSTSSAVTTLLNCTFSPASLSQVPG